MLPLVAAPLVALLLAGILGIVARSWALGLKHAGLVVVWVAWFVVSAKFVPSDLVIWASVALLGLHVLGMAGWVVRQAGRRHIAGM